MSAGSSIAASTDLYTFEHPSERSTFEVPGTYLLASRELAQRYTDDLLVVSGANGYSDSCERGASEDFTLDAAPEDRERVVVAQNPTHNEADREVAQHVLDTFEADCEGIP